MNRVQLTLEILALFGVDDPGNVARAEIVLAAGKPPTITVQRWVKTLGAQPARVLRTSHFDLVPRNDPWEGP